MAGVNPSLHETLVTSVIKVESTCVILSNSWLRHEIGII